MTAKKKLARNYGDGSTFPYTLSTGEQRFRAQWNEDNDPTDPTKGRRRVTKAGFLTEKEARDHMTAMMQKPQPADNTDDTASTAHTPADNLTLNAYIREWFAASRHEETTLAGYKKLNRLHIEPYLGSLKIRLIRPQMLAAHYRMLEQRGRKQPGRKGEPLGPNTVHKVHQLLSVVLTSAVADGIIDTNPAKSPAAKPPTGKEIKKAKAPMVVWDRDELAAFLTWSKENQPARFPIWWVISRTGMRRSEIAGLTWSDVHLDGTLGARIVVQRAEVVIKNKGEKERQVAKGTKNGDTVVITLDPDTADILRAHRVKSAQDNLANVRPDAHVFRLANGDHLRPDYITIAFQKSLEQCNATRADNPLPHLTPHGLRHTHASHLLAAGVPGKVVQERLGHRTIGITLNLYTHVMPDLHTEAVTKLSDYLNKVEKDDKGVNVITPLR